MIDDLERAQVDVAVRYVPEGSVTGGRLLFGETVFPVCSPELAKQSRESARDAGRSASPRAALSRARARGVARLGALVSRARPARLRARRQAALQPLRSADPGRARRPRRGARPAPAAAPAAARAQARRAVQEQGRVVARLLRRGVAGREERRRKCASSPTGSSTRRTPRRSTRRAAKRRDERRYETRAASGNRSARACRPRTSAARRTALGPRS